MHMVHKGNYKLKTCNSQQESKAEFKINLGSRTKIKSKIVRQRRKSCSLGDETAPFLCRVESIVY